MFCTWTTIVFSIIHKMTLKILGKHRWDHRWSASTIYTAEQPSQWLTKSSGSVLTVSGREKYIFSASGPAQFQVYIFQSKTQQYTETIIWRNLGGKLRYIKDLQFLKKIPKKNSSPPLCNSSYRMTFQKQSHEGMH